MKGPATAPRPLGRPRDGDSAETRERLLAVAREAFARHGFESTTNREIAAAADLTTGAIYHYYPSKGDLYLAVYDEVQHLVLGAFERAAAGHERLVDRLGAVLDAAVAMNRTDQSLAGFLVGVPGVMRRHPELAAQLAPRRAATTTTSTFFGPLVDEAAARGELADGVDARAVEDMLNAAMSGLARFSTQTGDAHRHAAAVDALKRLLRGTLVSPRA